MTIRSSINARALNAALSNLEECAREAPDGTYEFAKDFEDFFGELYEFIKLQMAQRGLKIDNCDSYRECEVLIYNMIKAANPEAASTFAVSEGFGAACQMGADVRERVISNARRDKMALDDIALRDDIAAARGDVAAEKALHTMFGDKWPSPEWLEEKAHRDNR